MHPRTSRARTAFGRLLHDLLRVWKSNRIDCIYFVPVDPWVERLHRHARKRQVFGLQSSTQ